MELHRDKMVKTGSCSSKGVKLSEQPLHLKVFQTLEHEHLRDKKDSAQLSKGQTAAHTNVMGQQLSAPECHIQLQGTEAKLQAKINQLYPCVHGSGKPQVNKTVEQIKSSTIRSLQLNNEGKAGAHSPESSSTTSVNNSISNPPRKKAKGFGSRNHIHTMAEITDSKSSKEIIVKDNVAILKDRD